MRIAIAIHNERISPVFDVAARLTLVDVDDNNAEVSRSETPLAQTDLPTRCSRLTELNVDVLICGAISRPLEWMLTAAGVRVIPQTCGMAEEVIQAFLTGQLTQQAFLMPGCFGRRGQRRGRGRGRGRGRWNSRQ